MGGKVAAKDGEVARVAASQHGVISTSQLMRVGLSGREIQVREQLGRLHRVHQGVYAVGHPALSQYGRWMAAVLSCHGYVPGAEAFLSHRSAAALWGLLPDAVGLTDVAIIGENGRARRQGVRVHRPRTLEIEMTTRQQGIPLTGPRRTISDLKRAKPSRGGATPAQMRRALRQAAVLGLPLGPGTKPERTRSDLEILFQGICRRFRLPEPELNVRIQPQLEVDFLWPVERLVIETDGYKYHRGRIAFESDHNRDLRLVEMGYRLLRFSEVQLETEPGRVANIVAENLRRLSNPVG